MMRLRPSFLQPHDAGRWWISRKSGPQGFDSSPTAESAPDLQTCCITHLSHWSMHFYTHLGQATPFATSCIRECNAAKDRGPLRSLRPKSYEFALLLHDDAGLSSMQESVLRKHSIYMARAVWGD